MADRSDDPQVISFRLCVAEHAGTPEREEALEQAHMLLNGLRTTDLIAMLPVLGKYAVTDRNSAG